MDAVVVGVGHHNAAVEGGDGDAVRIVEVAVAVAALAELELERAVGVEDLDAVVIIVGRDKLVRVVKSDAAHIVGELPVVYAIVL